MSAVECPVCRRPADAEDAVNTARLELSPNTEFRVRLCGCGHRFLWPVPDEEALAAFYRGAPGYDAGRFVARMESFDHAPQFVDTLRYLEALLPSGAPKTVVDFGCGTGHFLAVARRAGWQAVGVEPTPSLAAAAAARTGATIHGDADPFRAPIADGSVPVIHVAHVLEHLPQPLETLGLFHRWLMPGGVLFVQVPNQLGDALWPLLHRHWLEHGRGEGFQLHHLQFFSPASLRTLLLAGGFRLEACSTHFRLRNQRAVASGRNPMVRWAKWAAYSAAAPLGRGPHIEAVARKPAAG